MKPLKRARLVATFDPEPLIGSILQYGMIVSVGCILSALIWHGLATHRVGFDNTPEGRNVFEMLLIDLRGGPPLKYGPSLIAHCGVAALLLVPYLQVLALLWYFACIEHNARYAVFAGCVGVVMSYILFFG